MNNFNKLSLCLITLLCTMHAFSKSPSDGPAQFIRNQYVATPGQTPEQQETLRRSRSALIARLELAGMRGIARRLQQNFFGNESN